jgi:RNA polymerase sigma-70 factor, ECF subfamily
MDASLRSEHSAENAEVAEWIEASRCGSQDALGSLMAIAHHYLLHVARGELPADLQAKLGASDVVQETLLEAVRDFHQFQGHTEAEWLAWLRHILLHNLANCQRRFRETGKRQVSRERPLDDRNSRFDPQEVLAADSSSPSQRAIKDEEAMALQRALDQLPEHYRQVILLRHREQCSFDEIGRRMNRSADAARMVWWRAIDRLQQVPELQR